LSSRLCGARTWLHVQDFEVDAAFELGLLKSQGLRASASRLERALMRRFDRVSSISHRMLDRLRDKGVGESRIRLLPNWVDTTQIRPLTGEIALRTELGLPPDRPVLLYSGNMGVKQGLELLVAVAREFAGDAAPLFVFCGDGAVRAGIEAAARDLPNVRFLPLQPLERFNELLNLASVHLLPQRADAEDLVMPSKLTAIMASGRPVIAAARAGTELARVAAEGGLVVQPGSAPAFAAAIQRLLGDAALRERFGHSGRAYALAHWSRDAVLERMQAEFDSALHKSDTSAG
jgi:colanic acid biosynthesis glycosyl transferase WcaI